MSNNGVSLLNGHNYRLPQVSYTGFNNIPDLVNGLSEYSNSSSIGSININIPIDHVEDYNDFVRQLKSDGKFEKFIRSVTIDRLNGKGSLDKNRYS